MSSGSGRIGKKIFPCRNSCNQLRSLKDFSYCTSLRELYVRNNQVPSLDQIVWLKELPRLRILWLDGNPCCRDAPDSETYRLTVLRHLPQLDVLDNEKIGEDERERVHEVALSLPELTLPVRPVSSGLSIASSRDATTPREMPVSLDMLKVAGDNMEEIEDERLETATYAIAPAQAPALSTGSGSPSSPPDSGENSAAIPRSQMPLDNETSWPGFSTPAEQQQQQQQQTASTFRKSFRSARSSSRSAQSSGIVPVADSPRAPSSDYHRTQTPEPLRRRPLQQQFVRSDVHASPANSRRSLRRPPMDSQWRDDISLVQQQQSPVKPWQMTEGEYRLRVRGREEGGNQLKYILINCFTFCRTPIF